MPTTLLDFPSEVIQLIFGYLPISYLQKLVDIPSVKHEALNSLYVNITIGGTEARISENSDELLGLKRVGFDFDMGEPGTRFESPLEFMDAIDSGRIPKPKEIIFDSFTDLAELVQIDKTILRNVKVGFHMGYFKNLPSNDPQADVLLELLPYVNVFEMFEDIPGYWLVDYLLTIDKYGPNPVLHYSEYAITFLCKTMPFLKCLSIDRIVTKGVIALLPRTLTQLSCSVESFEIDADEELPFPPKLKSLSLILQEAPATFNIQGLSELWEFMVLNPNANHHIRLPPNLRLFHISNGFVYVDEVLRQCPNLYGFLYKGLIGFQIKTTNSQLLAQSKISKLILPQHEFFAMNSRMSLKLPETLQELGIEGVVVDSADVVPLESVILDFERNKLESLSKLSLLLPQNFVLIGHLPASLTELTYYVDRDFKFEWLQDTPNLRKLFLRDAVSPEYKVFECNTQLELLEMSQCDLSEAHIIAPNLKYLILSDNAFDEFSYDTLTIPESVIELDLSYSYTKRIYPNYRFPNNIRKLILDGNKFTELHGLPSNLKEFSCSYNGSDMTWFGSLPSKLEILRLSDAKIKDKDMELLNLKELTCLQRLSLGKNFLTILKIDDLPKSLTHLMIQDNLINNIEGRFSSLPNLAELDIRNNNVGQYFSANSSSAVGFVGPKIRYLHIKGNNIEDFDMMVLLGDAIDQLNL
ncbi:hypothetical protein G210_4978 [Candida maltosa Xu316]|uniref:Uncharacterized protein n=1 Tax=Candida maltosa (strain Xu316) TaxID=1245528 RepID=M3K418_CANMX|nr:hypothetical protein G210_4978 [Candida maltosa Xu316]